MRIPKITTALVAVAFATSVGIGPPAVASAAAISHLPTVAHSIHVGPRPEVNNFLTYTGMGETGIRTPYLCIGGSDVPISQDPVESVVNNCEYHVYLQYSNQPADCVNPGDTRNIADPSDRNPNAVQIGPGEGAC